MKHEVKGSFSTPVTFKMILAYLFAWILGVKIEHTNISVVVSDEPLTGKKNEDE